MRPPFSGRSVAAHGRKRRTMTGIEREKNTGRMRIPALSLSLLREIPAPQSSAWPSIIAPLPVPIKRMALTAPRLAMVIPDASRHNRTHEEFDY
jgi:hypothetical protein